MNEEDLEKKPSSEMCSLRNLNNKMDALSTKNDRMEIMIERIQLYLLGTKED